MPGNSISKLCRAAFEFGIVWREQERPSTRLVLKHSCLINPHDNPSTVWDPSHISNLMTT
jgi:hypothetical protein